MNRSGSGDPNASSLDTHSVEVIDLKCDQDKNHQLSALIQLHDLMLVIIFEDANLASIVFDKRAFQIVKAKTKSQTNSLMVIAPYTHIFGRERDKRKSYDIYQIRHGTNVEREKVPEAEKNVEESDPRISESTNINPGCSQTSQLSSQISSQLSSQKSSEKSSIDDEEFKRPDSTLDEEIMSIEANLQEKLLTFKYGQKTMSFDLILNPNHERVKQFHSTEWIPKNPPADPIDKADMKRAKEEGAKLREIFWKDHFPNPFNMFHRMAIKNREEMQYYFIPVSVLLTKKQEGYLQRDWERVTESKSTYREVYVLFDRDLGLNGTEYSGKFEFFIQINFKICLGLGVCATLTGERAHDGKAFRVVKASNFCNSKTTKTIEAFREHWFLHRKQPTWKLQKVHETVKKDDAAHIMDKAAMLVPDTALSYNFYARTMTRDFLIEISEYRARTSNKALISLLDKLGSSRGSFVKNRLDTMTAEWKKVCLARKKKRFFLN